MRSGWYNFSILAGTVASWAAWGFVVTQYYPDTGGMMPFFYFFSTLFIALVGTIYLGGYVLQARFIGRLNKLQSVRSCTRQALLFSTLLVISLMLQGLRLLTLVNMLLLIALLTFIELLFLSRERRPVMRERAEAR